jgi:hypothetical protein
MLPHFGLGFRNTLTSAGSTLVFSRRAFAASRSAISVARSFQEMGMDEDIMQFAEKAMRIYQNYPSHVQSRQQSQILRRLAEHVIKTEKHRRQDQELHDPTRD